MMRKQPARVSEVGRSIRRAVKENPGIHFRGLGRAAQVTSAGQLRHHLDRLQSQGVLIEVEDGRYKRFFHAGDHDPALRAEMARFARAVPRRIAKLLLLNPMNRTQLRRSLGCADSTLGYHLTRMVTLGDLSRNRGPNSCLYSLTSREQVSRIMLLQGEQDARYALEALPAQQRVGTMYDEDVPSPLRPQPAPSRDPPFPTRPFDPPPLPSPAPQPEPRPRPEPEPQPAPNPQPGSDPFSERLDVSGPGTSGDGSPPTA